MKLSYVFWDSQSDCSVSNLTNLYKDADRSHLKTICKTLSGIGEIFGFPKFNANNIKYKNHKFPLKIVEKNLIE